MPRHPNSNRKSDERPPYQHCARVLREAQLLLAEAVEQVRHAEARRAEAMAPADEPRQAQRQAADLHPDEPMPMRRRMRR